MRLIYLAGPWLHRLRIKGIADQLRASGHQVVSRWHDEWALRSDIGISFEELESEARMDLADVRACDVLLLINWEGSTGGMFVEQGYAMALHKPVVVVGSYSNVFHHLPGVHVVGSLAAALDTMARLP